MAEATRPPERSDLLQLCADLNRLHAKYLFRDYRKPDQPRWARDCEIIWSPLMNWALGPRTSSLLKYPGRPAIGCPTIKEVDLQDLRRLKTGVWGDQGLAFESIVKEVRQFAARMPPADYSTGLVCFPRSFSALGDQRVPLQPSVADINTISRRRRSGRPPGDRSAMASISVSDSDEAPAEPAGGPPGASAKCGASPGRIALPAP
jgi:hypothetical protein